MSSAWSLRCKQKHANTENSRPRRQWFLQTRTEFEVLQYANVHFPLSWPRERASFVRAAICSGFRRILLCYNKTKTTVRVLLESTNRRRSGCGNNNNPATTQDTTWRTLLTIVLLFRAEIHEAGTKQKFLSATQCAAVSRCADVLKHVHLGCPLRRSVAVEGYLCCRLLREDLNVS